MDNTLETDSPSVYTPGIYNSGEKVEMQSGPSQGTYLCAQDGNTSSPATGLGWIKISAPEQWF